MSTRLETLATADIVDGGAVNQESNGSQRIGLPILLEAQHNGLGIAEFSSQGIVELKDDLGMRKGEPAFAVAFDRVVKDVVDLYYAIMREGTIRTGDVLHGITRPADIAGPGAILEPAIGRAAALVLHRSVVDRVVWPAGKFVDVVSDLDRKAVVEITGENKNRLIEPVPELDEFLPLLEEYGPGVVLLDLGLFVCPAPAPDVWHHEVD